MCSVPFLSTLKNGGSDQFSGFLRVRNRKLQILWKIGNRLEFSQPKYSRWTKCIKWCEQTQVFSSDVCHSISKYWQHSNRAQYFEEKWISKFFWWLLFFTCNQLYHSRSLMLHMSQKQSGKIFASLTVLHMILFHH